jgi:hypothetical protein
MSKEAKASGKPDRRRQSILWCSGDLHEPQDLLCCLSGQAKANPLWSLLLHLVQMLVGARRSGSIQSSAFLRALSALLFNSLGYLDVSLGVKAKDDARRATLRVTKWYIWRPPWHHLDEIPLHYRHQSEEGSRARRKGTDPMCRWGSRSPCAWRLCHLWLFSVNTWYHFLYKWNQSSSKVAAKVIFSSSELRGFGSICWVSTKISAAS